MNIMEKDHFQLIAKYLAGEASEAENKDLLAFINENEGNRKLFIDLKDKYLLAGVPAKKRYHRDKNWNSIQQKINQPGNSTNFFLQNNYMLMKIAAVFVIAFTTGFLINNTIGGHKEGNNPVCEVKAANGARSFVVLSDSTKVWLNAGSTLKLSNDFNKGSRNVYLDGEAYFDVQKSKNNYFTVFVSDIFIKVLGTQFNVKSYAGDDVIETTLETGTVKIYEADDRKQIATLSPNQKATYLKNSQNLSKESINRELKKIINKDEIIHYREANYIIADEVKTDNYSSWKDGKLIFRKDRLADIVSSLERHFNVDITIKDDRAKDLMITANFKNETIEQVMYALKLTSSVDYEINLNNISIKLDTNEMMRN